MKPTLDKKTGMAEEDIMIRITQTNPKQFEVTTHDGELVGSISESIGFWVVQLGHNTPKACESYERAVVLAEQHCQCAAG